MKGTLAAETLNPSVWTKLHVQLSAGQIRRDMAALLPPTGHEGDSAEGAYIVVQLLAHTTRAPPLWESQWELPPVGSHSHPPPASQRRALRWPPPYAGAAVAPATSADGPHRSERAVRRPSRYAGEDDDDEMEPDEAEEGSLAGPTPTAVAAMAVAPADSIGGRASLARPDRLPLRQAESHAYMAVQDLHEEDEVQAPMPAQGRALPLAGEFSGVRGHAHIPAQQAPPWQAAQQAGLGYSQHLRPAGFTAWVGSSLGGEGRPDQHGPTTPVAQPLPPHPMTPPAAAGGATLPLLQDSQAQHNLAGPAASALRLAQRGHEAQRELEHWMAVAAAHLPIPAQEPKPGAASKDMQPAGGARGAAQQAASMQDVQALQRAMQTPATQQPAH